MLNSGSLCLFQTIQSPLIVKRPSTPQCKVSRKSPELSGEPSRGQRERNPLTKSIQKMLVKLSQPQIPRYPHQPASPLPCSLSKDPKKEANLDPHRPAGGPSANTLVFTHPGLHFPLPCPFHFFHWEPQCLGRECGCSGWTHPLELAS